MHLLFALSLVFVACLANAQPIRVGDISSYGHAPTQAQAYRQGWMLAQERINRAGGVGGRRIEVVSRDEGASPAIARKAAEELVTREKVHVLMGGLGARESLAISKYAGEQRVVYVAAGSTSDELTGNSNRYTFRLRLPGSALATMLMPEALKLKKRYWAVVHAHDGSDAAAVRKFKELLSQAQPQSQVLELAMPRPLESRLLTAALQRTLPEAIFTTLTGGELQALAEALPADGEIAVVSLHGGEPELLQGIRHGVTQGWWVTGYPRSGIDYMPHNQFSEAYLQRWGEAPGTMSVVGYSALLSIAQAIRRGKSSASEDLRRALEGLETLTPWGVIDWRRTDRQATLGTFVGQLSHRGGRELVRWRFENGRGVLKPEPWELTSGSAPSDGRNSGRPFSRPSESARRAQ